MHVRRCAQGLSVLAPAKLNLFLEVLGRRADGYHELETLMYPIRLFDSLWLERARPDEPVCLSLWPQGAGASRSPAGVPAGPENLVVRAVELLRARAGVAAGLRAVLVKRIPVAAGLGGGSSDAAAALLGANLLWDLRWPREQLAEVAAELGSDVPFFLYDGPAVCRGRGERIEPLAGLPACWWVVVQPPAGLSTAAVYKACAPAAAPQSVAPLIAALRQGRLAEAARCFRNGLQAAAAGLSHWIERLAAEFAQCGFVGHQMSGSGTSYFGLCRTAREAQRQAARLRSRGWGRVYCVAGGG